MKRVILAALVLVCLAGPAVAQDTPKAEVFGGYSYFRFGGNATLGGGWHGSIAGNVNSWFGVFGEFSGHYGEDRIGRSIRLHTVTFGPRFSFRKHEKVTPFVHFSYGLAHLPGGWANYGVVTAGAGVDIKASDRIAIRAGQFDYVVTGFGLAQQNFRYSGGLVLRFGSK